MRFVSEGRQAFRVRSRSAHRALAQYDALASGGQSIVSVLPSANESPPPMTNGLDTGHPP